ncbi:MAG: GTPase, partial [Crinalium sp.]
MVRLKLWQWIVLALPVASIIGFLLVAAGLQIHEWRINWIWGIFTVIFLGWRWLLVKWTQPMVDQMESVIAQVSKDLASASGDAKLQAEGNDTASQAEVALQEILTTAQSDRPIWEDWQTFWQRCQELVAAIAQIYNPELKYPLLNIYIPQVYTLIRGTVDDLDRWIQQLSPALNQATVGQAYEAYEVYRKLEPSARKVWKVWNWAQWLLNPVAAVAKTATKPYNNQASQQLLVNVSQLLREAALRNLCRQAIALYSGILPTTELSVPTPSLPKAKTQTLRDILTEAEPVEQVEQKPVNIILAGRTGAGKSSLINTLFQAELAEVDILPSTDKIQNYHWQVETGETLTLWDTPGYEQVNREDLRAQVIDYATTADLLLLVTPALDPALQMDVDFLKEINKEVKDLPAIAIVTQVDRLRPIREWQPPYDWEWGEKPKEVAIREAT